MKDDFNFLPENRSLQNFYSLLDDLYIRPSEDETNIQNNNEE